MFPRYLFPADYMADPAAKVFDGRVYIYPSHDWDSGASEDDDGGHFQMKDYHVLSLDDIENGEVTDHGVILALEDVPWAAGQLWDSDVCKGNDGRYYLYFSAKDYNGLFHIGVAIADKPEGPFKAEPYPIYGSYSIDPCAFKDVVRFTSISEVSGVDSFKDIRTTRFSRMPISQKVMQRLFRLV